MELSDLGEEWGEEMWGGMGVYQWRYDEQRGKRCKDVRQGAKGVADEGGSIFDDRASVGGKNADGT